MAKTGPVVNIDAQLASEIHIKCEIELKQLKPWGSHANHRIFLKRLTILDINLVGQEPCLGLSFI